ncbi:hypothetical protein SLS57_000363 [Botryosphaeria dothidea]
MKSIFAAASFFDAALGAVLAGGLETLTIPIPSQGEPFTSTVSACGTVDAFAVVGVPNGTFFPGTQTIFLPPQASATSATFFDDSSDIEVIIATPLQGSCAPFSVSASTTFTDISQLTATGSDGTPTATDSANCPLGTLAATVDKAAQEVIDAINKVTLISQNLQAAAKQIGANSQKKRSGSSDLAIRQFNKPIIQVVSGLRDVVVALTTAIPRISVLPPFAAADDNDPDPGDASDAIVIALISFVRVHQALLNILIGRSGLISNFPFGDTAASDELNAIAAEGQAALEKFLSAAAPAAAVEGRAAQVNPIGAPIAAVLRQVESVVDQLAFALIRLIPTRNECAKEQKTAIDGSLDEAIEAYS